MHPVSFVCSLCVWLFLIDKLSHGGERIFVDGTLGADGNDGHTERQALKTIAKAIERAMPGDQVIVLAGDYCSEDTGWGKGSIPITKSGANQRPIFITGKPGAIVSRVLLKNVRYVVIEGLTFRGREFRDLANWTDMPTIVRNVPHEQMRNIDYTKDWKSRKYRIESVFSTYFRLLKKLEYDVAIDIDGCESITIRDNKIDGYWAGIQCRGLSKSEITTNHISHTRNGIYTWDSTLEPNKPSIPKGLADGEPLLLPSQGLRASRIRRNVITQSLDSGIDLRRNSQDVIVEQNSIIYSGISHIALLDGTSRCVVRWNVVSRGGFYSETMELPGSSAINLNHAGTDNVVEYNWASNQLDLTEIDGNGLILDLLQSQSNTIVRGNCLFRNRGSGLNMTASPNAVVYGNVFAFNGHLGSERHNGAGMKFSRDQDVGNTVLGNLFLYNRAAAILSYRILNKQKAIDWNMYLSAKEPLCWDGFDPLESSYRSLEEVRSNTPWEKHGIHLSPW
jgi:hypothetical protein